MKVAEDDGKVTVPLLFGDTSSVRNRPRVARRQVDHIAYTIAN
jgi:hypothetical protein